MAAHAHWLMNILWTSSRIVLVTITSRRTIRSWTTANTLSLQLLEISKQCPLQKNKEGTEQVSIQLKQKRNYTKGKG